MVEKNDILKQMKNALETDLSGNFILLGEEEYLKKSFVSDIRKKLFESEEALFLDCNVFDGEGCGFDIIGALNQPPMLSYKRLIIWYGALGTGQDIKELCSVLEESKNAIDCVLVIYLYSGEFDARSSANRTKLSKLSSLGQIFDFESPSPQKLVKWAIRHFKADGIEVDEQTALYLVNRLCCDMTSLDSEIKKLSAYASETGSSVDRQVIDKIVPARIVFEDFYLIGRIDAFDSEGVLRYVNRELAVGAEPIALLAQISSEIEKLARIKCAMKEGYRPQAIAKAMGMHEYALKLKLSALHGVKEEHLLYLQSECYEADRAMKSSGCDNTVLLQSLICKL